MNITNDYDSLRRERVIVRQQHRWSVGELTGYLIGPFQILVTKQKKSLFLSQISSSVRFIWSFFVVVIVRGVFFRNLEMMYAV